MSYQPALSPSRVNDFATCPLQFRLLVVDKIPQAPTLPQKKGTLIHSVLEGLFNQDAHERTRESAEAALVPAWEAIEANEPDLAEQLFSSAAERDEFLDDARRLLSHYFALEDPTHLAPAGLERYVKATIGDGLHIHGYIDRVDIAANGAVRIVDYKTGKSPRERYLGPYLLQLRMYALAWRESEGVTPARLQLHFLKDTRTFTHDPKDAELDATVDHLVNVWRDIERAASSGSFRPRKNPLCPWCPFQHLCPVFGGKTPPLPAAGIDRLLAMHD